MSITASPGGTLPPEPDEQRFSARAEGRGWFSPVVIAVLVILAVSNFIVFYELSAARKQFDQQLASLKSELKERTAVLERRLATGEERHNDLRGEVLVTREKLGMTQRDLNRAASLAQALKQEQQQAYAKIGQVGQQVTSLREESGAQLGALSGEVSTAKSDIVATRKELEQTRIQLTSAIGDITKAHTLIARNHDELMELKRRGERNYFEFDLPKERQPRRVADISLLLKKADPKRQRYTLEVIAEDSRTEKKDKTVNEPVQLYAGRSRALYEIVVNRVGKDRVSGYVATPK